MAGYISSSSYHASTNQIRLSSALMNGRSRGRPRCGRSASAIEFFILSFCLLPFLAGCGDDGDGDNDGWW